MNSSGTTVASAPHMHTRLSILAVLICLAAPAIAHAQTTFPVESWSLSGGLGLALDPDADASLSIAGAVGYQLTPLFVVEGELGHVLDMAPDNAAVDSSLTTAHGSLLYVFDSDYTLRPYLAAGLGAGHFSVNVEDSPRLSFDRTEFGFNLGAGVAYPLDDRTILRGDFRYFKHIDEVPSIWRFSGVITFRLSQ